MNPRLQIIDLDSDSQEQPVQALSSIQTKKLFSQNRFKSDIISKNTYFKNQEDDYDKQSKNQYDKTHKKQHTNMKKQQYKTFKRISKYNPQQMKQQSTVLDGKQLHQQSEAIEQRPISKFIEQNQEEIILSTQLPPVKTQKKTSQLMKIQLTSSQQESDIEEIKWNKQNNPEKNDEQQEQVSQEKPGKKEKIVCSDVVISKRQFIQTFKDKKKRLRLNVKRDKTGFNRLWTRYDIMFAGDCRYLASIQKSISATSTNYLVSLCTDDFESPVNFLGRIKKGMLSSQYIIYDSTQKQLGKKSKNIIGTMCFGVGQQQVQQGPRNFLFYCLKDPFKYADLQGISKQQIPLDKLYEIPQNKEKIHVFNNRKAVWCKKLQGFVMDFNNRIDKASVKNMIMEDQNSQQVLMFGRIGDDLFTLDVSYPLTPLLAFGIAATVFDYRSTVYG